jgi:Enoyl-(Acyl carrier protein) reductase
MPSLAKSNALGRPGKPEKIAALVALIASDEAAYITGATAVIDGSLSMNGVSSNQPLDVIEALKSGPRCRSSRPPD